MTELSLEQQQDIEKTLSKLATVKVDIESAYALGRAGQLDAGVVLTIHELALQELCPLLAKNLVTV